jgi:hypothetical protein
MRKLLHRSHDRSAASWRLPATRSKALASDVQAAVGKAVSDTADETK